MLTDDAHNAKMALIRKDHWRQYETAFEHDERADACESSAYLYFRRATEGQQAAYQRALADVMGDYSPRANRARYAAERRWVETTAEARALFAETFEALMRDGEVSEELAASWDALPVYVEMAEVA
jgi:hypothetical protein